MFQQLVCRIYEPSFLLWVAHLMGCGTAGEQKTHKLHINQLEMLSSVKFADGIRELIVPAMWTYGVCVCTWAWHMCIWPKITAQYPWRYLCKYDKEAEEFSVVKKYGLVMFKSFFKFYFLCFRCCWSACFFCCVVIFRKSLCSPVITPDVRGSVYTSYCTERAFTVVF